MTYKELIIKLFSELTWEQLDCDAVVFVSNTDDYYPIREISPPDCKLTTNTVSPALIVYKE